MRWPLSLPPGQFKHREWYWRAHFALFPLIIEGHVVWLEEFERLEQFWINPDGWYFFTYGRVPELRLKRKR